MQNDPQGVVSWGKRQMDKAGWLDVWHMAAAIVARQPPFLQILYWTGAVFVIVMAIEGMRTSLISIARAHRAAPQPASAKPEPIALAAPSSVEIAPLSRNFSLRSVPRAAAGMARKRKALTTEVRRFTSPRPTIRRHPMLEFASVHAVPDFSADSAVLQHEGV